MSPEVQEWLRSIGLVVFTSVLTWLFTRRKVDAETKATQAKAAVDDIDTDTKISNLLEEMRGKNSELIRSNVELEKQVTDQGRTIDIQTKELAKTQKQLSLLRELAEQSPLIEILNTQIEVIGGVITILQSAVGEGSKLVVQKQKTMEQLLNTTNDLGSESRKSLK